MTNLEKIKNMDIDILAAWLDEHGMFDHSPWSEWWDKNYCSKCESVECSYADAEEKLSLTPFYNETFECAYCELADENGITRCRFFPELDGVPDNETVIKMWLEEEAE